MKKPLLVLFLIVATLPLFCQRYNYWTMPDSVSIRTSIKDYFGYSARVTLLTVNFQSYGGTKDDFIFHHFAPHLQPEFPDLMILRDVEGENIYTLFSRQDGWWEKVFTMEEFPQIVDFEDQTKITIGNGTMLTAYRRVYLTSFPCTVTWWRF